MRDYVGVAPSTLPPADSPTFQARLRHMLTDIDYYLKDLSRGQARIQAGEVPDGSGNLIGNNGTLLDYLFLPGRSGGQIAHGDTADSGTLTLRSTASQTRGKIFLGGSTAYDEANVRLGIGTTIPADTLHLDQAAGVVNARPTATSGSINNWRGQDAGSTNLQNYVNETTANDATYITETGLSPGTSITYVFWTAGNIPFSGSPTITLRFRTRRATGSAGTEQLHFDLYRAATLVKGQNSGVLTTSFVDYSYTLTASEVTSLFNAGADGCTIDLFAVGLGSAGYDIAYVAMEIGTAATGNLARWDTGGTQTGRITVDGYVESRRLMLLGTTSGTITLTGGTSPTSHSYTLPTEQGAASTVLTNDGSGTLSWGTGSAGLSVAGYPSFGFDSFGQSDAAVITKPSISGVMAVRAAPVNLTGQTASIGTTTLLTPSSLRMFMIAGYMTCTTAGDAGDFVSLNLSWNDGTVAQSVLLASCSLDSIGSHGESIFGFIANASAISYSTILSSPGAGTPAHTLYLRILVI